MPWIDFRLVATLAAAMLVVQAVCWLLARGLGLRLRKEAVIASWLAPIVLLAPWLAGNPLLVPCDILQVGVPGAPSIERPRQHDVLNDAVYQLLPWELEVRHALSDRRLPFWSDALEGGSSLWANPQAGAASPLQMAARALPIQHHLLGAFALKLLVAFQGTWLLARLLGRSRAASLLAAAGFSLGGALASWALFPVTAAAAWIPWLAAGTIRLFRRPGRRTIATTAAITGALLLSGHPETAAFGGLFAAVCGLCLRRRKTGLARGFGAAAAAAVLGFGLAAPHVLPFLAIVPDSQRAQDTLAEEPPSGVARALDPRTWFVPEHHAFMLAPLGPHVYGRPYRDPFTGPFNWPDSEAGYAGLLAFAGAMIALLAVRDRRLWPFLGFTIAALLLAARFLPLAHLLYAVPPLRVPAYARCLLPGSLALCIAGAFGVDLLLSRSRRTALAGIGFGLAALASLAVTADRWTIGLWAALAAAFALARLRPRWGVVALLAVLLADLVPWSRSFLPEGHPSLFYPRTEAMDVFAREAGDPAVWRGAGADFLLYPNLLPVYGVADFRPHNPLAPVRQLRVLDAAFGYYPTMKNYFSPLRNLDHPLLDFLGARIVLGSPAVTSGRTLPRIDGGRFPPYTLLRNPDARPRWFVPEAVDVIERRQAAAWIAGMTTAGRVALFRDQIGSWRPAAADGGPAPKLLASAPGRVVLEVPGGGERLLATSIAWSRGWSARGGGRELPALTVNGAFLGVRLPGGVSRVELRFLPPGFVLGCAAFAVAAVVVLILYVGAFYPARPHPKPLS
jgi:ABC-type glycerol-3-phosphate transport system permease component